MINVKIPINYMINQPTTCYNILFKPLIFEYFKVITKGKVHQKRGLVLEED